MGLDFEGIWAVATIMFWAMGMVALFTNSRVANLLWSFPAGVGGGHAIAHLLIERGM